jgi:hypothetical protein
VELAELTDRIVANLKSTEESNLNFNKVIEQVNNIVTNLKVIEEQAQECRAARRGPRKTKYEIKWLNAFFGHGRLTSTAARIEDRETTMRSGLHPRVILGETK